ncbi:MAG: hypothetical protein PHR25_04290 [Clostridia bacterium]|nr:hypothetical protein [Clostridia bacterium]MDD4375982.1 hypothetical protein [Clostridia bacterium]
MTISDIDLSFSTIFNFKGKSVTFHLFPQQVSSDVLLFNIHVVAPDSTYKRPKGYVYYNRITAETFYNMPFYEITDYRIKAIFTKKLREKIELFNEIVSK